MTLFQGVGGNGDDFIGTVLDDDARTPIADGVAPFADRFQPAEQLAAFHGEDPNGVWLLQVHDYVVQGEGTLRDWTLRLGHGDLVTTTSNDGQYMLTDVLPGQHSVRVIPNQGWSHSDPPNGQRLTDVTAGSKSLNNDYGVHAPAAAPQVRIWGPPSVQLGSAYMLHMAAPAQLGISQWEIHWGDGTVESIAGNPSTATHVYSGGAQRAVIQAIAFDSLGRAYEAIGPDIDINFMSLDDSTMWTLNGSAVMGAADNVDNVGVLRLTENSTHDVGSAFLSDPIPVGREVEFSAEFSLRVSQSGGASQPGRRWRFGWRWLGVCHTRRSARCPGPWGHGWRYGNWRLWGGIDRTQPVR